MYNFKFKVTTVMCQHFCSVTDMIQIEAKDHERGKYYRPIEHVIGICLVTVNWLSFQMSYTDGTIEQFMANNVNPNIGKHPKEGWRWNINTDDFPSVKPALAPYTQLSLTITYICLYGFLFIFVLCQLWMIWYYRHKRFSYQTCFLFTCLIWSGLRTTLFSFYFNNCIQANSLPLFLNWLFYSFPVCLQFITLCLLVLFFGQASICRLIHMFNACLLIVFMCLKNNTSL